MLEEYRRVQAGYKPRDASVPVYRELPKILECFQYTDSSVVSAADGQDIGRLQHYYTCRKLAKNGDCTIYADRPAMCQRYPNERYCLYRDCTWEEWRCPDDVWGQWQAKMAGFDV